MKRHQEGSPKDEKLGGSGLTGQALRPATSAAVSVGNTTLVFIILMVVRREPPRELCYPRAVILCSPWCSPRDRASKHHQSGSMGPQQAEGYAVFRTIQAESEGLSCPALTLHGAHSPACANTCRYVALYSFPEILNIYHHCRHFAQLSGISVAIPKASFFYLT